MIQIKRKQSLLCFDREEEKKERKGEKREQHLLIDFVPESTYLSSILVNADRPKRSTKTSADIVAIDCIDIVRTLAKSWHKYNSSVNYLVF
ncbi:unnamed protein product [Rotaria socialis]